MKNSKHSKDTTEDIVHKLQAHDEYPDGGSSSPEWEEFVSKPRVRITRGDYKAAVDKGRLASFGRALMVECLPPQRNQTRKHVQRDQNLKFCLDSGHVVVVDDREFTPSVTDALFGLLVHEDSFYLRATKLSTFDHKSWVGRIVDVDMTVSEKDWRHPLFEERMRELTQAIGHPLCSIFSLVSLDCPILSLESDCITFKDTQKVRLHGVLCMGSILFKRCEQVTITKSTFSEFVRSEDSKGIFFSDTLGKTFLVKGSQVSIFRKLEAFELSLSVVHQNAKIQDCALEIMRIDDATTVRVFDSRIQLVTDIEQAEKVLFEGCTTKRDPRKPLSREHFGGVDESNVMIDSNLVFFVLD